MADLGDGAAERRRFAACAENGAAGRAACADGETPGAECAGGAARADGEAAAATPKIASGERRKLALDPKPAMLSWRVYSSNMVAEMVAGSSLSIVRTCAGSTACWASLYVSVKLDVMMARTTQMSCMEWPSAYA